MNGNLWLTFQEDPQFALGGPACEPIWPAEWPALFGTLVPALDQDRRTFTSHALDSEEMAHILNLARTYLHEMPGIPPRVAACLSLPGMNPHAHLDEILTIAQPGELWVDESIHHDMRAHLAFSAHVPNGSDRYFRVGDHLLRLPQIPLLGRSSTLAELQACWKTVLGRRALWVQVTGSAGMGKTRIIEHFRTHVAPEVNWIQTRAHPDGHAHPLEIPRQLLGALRSAPGDDLAPFHEEGKALGALLGLNESPPGLSPKHRNFMAFRALNRRLIEACAQEPTVLVIEDLHWLDPDSRAWLDSWYAELDSDGHDLPLLMLTSTRPAADASPVGRSRIGRVDLQLDPIPEESLKPWVRMALPELSETLVETFLARSGGNPLLTQELARVARAQVGGIPDEIRWDLEARLEMIPPAARDLLDWAALLGSSFDRRQVERLAAVTSSARPWRLVQDHGLVEVDSTEPDRLFFSHPLYLEVLREATPPVASRDRHTRIALDLWDHHADLDRVAHHLVRGNPTPRGREILIEASSAAIRRGAWNQARQYLYGAIAQSKEPPPPSLWLDLAELGLWLGEWDESGKLLASQPPPADPGSWLRGGLLLARWMEGRGRLEEAQDHLTGMQGDPRAQDGNRAARLSLHRARLALRLGEWTQVEQLTDTIRSDHESLTVDEQGHRASILGNLAFHRGNLESAISLHREALRLRESIGDLGASVGSWLNLGTCNFELGHWSESEKCFTRARELSDRTGEVWMKSLILNNQGHIALNRGKIDEAERSYREALSLKRELQEPAGEAIALTNLALLAWRRGKPEQARLFLDEAHGLLARSSHREVLPEILATEARIFARSTEPSRAHRACQRILEMTPGQPARAARGTALRILAEQELARGSGHEARSLARTCIEATEDRPRSLDRGRALATWSRVMRALGDVPASDRAREKARVCFADLEASYDLFELNEV